MEPIKQLKARNSPRLRSTTLTIRIDPRLRFLLELAAISEGRKAGNYVEAAIAHSFKDVYPDYPEMYDSEPESGIVFDPLARPTKKIGPSLADLADELWDEDEVQRFFNVALLLPRLCTEQQWALLNILRNSDKYHPLSPSGNRGPDGSPIRGWDMKAIRNDWQKLNAAAENKVAAKKGNNNGN